jgi:hypothetical protein
MDAASFLERAGRSVLGDQVNNSPRTRISCITLLFTLFLFTACAGVNLKTIPAPPPTAKLRVYTVAISNKPESRPWHYAVPHEKFESLMVNQVGQYLRETAIYDVVPKEDIKAVLGMQTPGDDAFWWFRNDCALLKQVGKAVHADYAMIVARYYHINATYKLILVNLETGMQYSASDILIVSFDGSNAQRGTKLLQSLYKKLFYDAKGDLLATAVRKRRLLLGKEVKKPAAPDSKLALASPSLPQAVAAPPPKPVPSSSKPLEKEKVSPPGPPAISQPVSAVKPPIIEKRPALTEEPLKPKTPVEIPIPKASVLAKQPESTVKKTSDLKKDMDAPKVFAKASPAPPSTQQSAQTPQADLTASAKRRDFEKKLESELRGATPETEKARLVVYDFNALENLSVVSLILTEALREELFMLDQYLLVNRENLQQVLQELNLQQSGLVDEKQIVKLGKWLAANEAVTGRLSSLGNTYILQAKLTDIRTMDTLGLGSLKCAAGQEEELLKGMPGLARRLVGLKGDFQ